MISPIDPLIKERKEAERGKLKIAVGLVVTAKDVDTEDKSREGRSRRIRNEVVSVSWML